MRPNARGGNDTTPPELLDDLDRHHVGESVEADRFTVDEQVGVPGARHTRHGRELEPPTLRVLSAGRYERSWRPELPELDERNLRVKSRIGCGFEERLADVLIEQWFVLWIKLDPSLLKRRFEPW